VEQIELRGGILTCWASDVQIPDSLAELKVPWLMRAGSQGGR